MSLYTKIKHGVTAPNGFVASAVTAGIKNPDAERLDMALIYSTTPCVSAATFTINKVRAAPVRISDTRNKKGNLRALFANSGNANACTGPDGLKAARAITKAVAKPLGLKESEVGICSTGVIGLPLPMARIEPKLKPLTEAVARKTGDDVARAIMTSDTHQKSYAISFDIDGHRVRIGACAKGAGMICPNMATMLCFITTDANISKENLQKATSECVGESFNRITIDGDMSTNDSVVVLANGQSGMPALRRNSKACKAFRDALHHVMLHMAQMLVKDGERTTKFVTVEVRGAFNVHHARRAAEAVANSALVKSSWNGNDPNWGRVIHAVGYSGAKIKEELIHIFYNGLPACINGMQADTPMDKLRKIVEKEEYTITIDLNRGTADYQMYSSDFSPEYVDFNRSEYAYWKQARKDGLV